MNNNLLKIEKEGGQLKASFSSSCSDRGAMMLLLEQLCDFNSNQLNNLLMFFDERFEKIGFLGSIHVEKEARGTGVGRELMTEFQDNIASKTEVDFLFARIDNPQQEGFDLMEFYEKLGFEPVKYSKGEMLMVNKGHAAEIKRDVFGIYSASLKNSDDDFEY